jgi:hypothetical protein
VLLEMAAALVAEGYALRDVLDYEEGLPFEEVRMLFRLAQKAAIERRRERVTDQQVAVGSLFDKEISQKFHHAVTRAIRALSDMTIEEAREKSMKELSKLSDLLGGPKRGERPPWERQ